MTLPPRDPDSFARQNWPWLLAVFGICMMWYEMNGNTFAGIAGFTGAGWLLWAVLIKPRL